MIVWSLDFWNEKIFVLLFLMLSEALCRSFFCEITKKKIRKKTVLPFSCFCFDSWNTMCIQMEIIIKISVWIMVSQFCIFLFGREPIVWRYTWKSGVLTDWLTGSWFDLWQATYTVYENNISLRKSAGFIAESRLNGESSGDVTAEVLKFGTAHGFSEMNVQRLRAEQGLVRNFCLISCCLSTEDKSVFRKMMVFNHIINLYRILRINSDMHICSGSWYFCLSLLHCVNCLLWIDTVNLLALVVYSQDNKDLTRMSLTADWTPDEHRKEQTDSSSLLNNFPQDRL